MRKWMPFGGRLLNGKLPPRHRELLILRTAWVCRAEYEWAHHVLIGGQAGLTAGEILSIRSSPPRFPASDDADVGGPGWTPLEAALLTAADELHNDQCIGDDTWRVLADHYDMQQLIEVPMVVGQYHLIAMTLKSLGVQLDPGLAGFPE